jgi:N-methylhydantoinase B
LSFAESSPPPPLTSETPPHAAGSRDGGSDAITLSVLLGRFASIASEMSLTLARTAWTPIIAICRDFSCAIYDAVPRQVAMFDAVPVHTTSMHLVLEEFARTFAGDINEGDVFVTNDPYRGNTHIGDLVTACPVFIDGELRFWSVAKGHQLDTGAFVPSSVTPAAQNVWQEGIAIPPLRLVDRGVAREDIVELYLRNVRYQESLRGDLRAQLAAIEQGRRRLIELGDEYGADTLMDYVEEMIAYADRRMSAAVRAIPDGVYHDVAWVDSDGFDEADIRVEARVTVADDTVTVDLGGSAPQVRGGMNGSYAVACAAAAVPFLFYVDPDIPHNHGCIRHIRVIAPEGTICNARFPASTSLATNCPSDAIQAAIHKAMAPALPSRVPAGGAKDANLPQLAGIDAAGVAWGAMIFNGSPGSGAIQGLDGWPIWESTSSAGSIRIQQVEQIELLYPLRVDCVEVERDSMGFGQWIGGAGTRFVLRALGEAPTECITFGDGMANPPNGIFGGTMGCGGGVYIEHDDGRPRRFVSVCGIVEISSQERWVSVSSGGGGFGRPCLRDPEQVRRDVRDGFVSAAAACEVFGVAVSDEFDPVIDAEATERRRAALRDRPWAMIEPTTPSASRWLESERRPGDVFLFNPR